MSRVFQVSILEASDSVYVGPCESLIIPTTNGSYGILAHHSDMIAAIVPGEMTWRIPGGENEVAAVSQGILKIEKGEVLVLADSIERMDEIDEKRSRERADAAKEAMLQKQSYREYREAEAALARAMNRLRVKKKYN